MTQVVPRDLLERSARAWRKIQASGVLEYAKSPLHAMGRLDQFVLVYLSVHGKSTVGAILDALAVKPSTLSSVIARLEKKKLILRSIAKEDYRSWNIAVSADGLELLAFHHQEELRVWAMLLEKCGDGQTMVAVTRGLEHMGE